MIELGTRAVMHKLGKSIPTSTTYSWLSFFFFLRALFVAIIAYMG
jgi:hypothetical protein